MVTVTSVAARVCVLGTEPDESAGGRVRFVLPPGDPCSCTQVMLGGHNAYAPPRKDQPVYIDTLPEDAEDLRRSQGCPNENAQSEDPKKTSTSLGKIVILDNIITIRSFESGVRHVEMVISSSCS